MKPNLDKDFSFKKNKDFHIGYSTKALLSDLKEKDLATRDAFDKLLFSIRSCVLSTVKNMLQRYPLGSVVVRNSVNFNPMVMQSADLNIVMQNLIFFCSI